MSTTTKVRLRDRVRFALAAFRSSPENPTTTLWEILEQYGGTKAAAGTLVNHTTALQLGAVYACVRVLAESVASLPCIVYERLDGGGKKRATTHPLYGLLHDEPNKYMSSFLFFETKQGHLALDGNAYSLIERDARGNVAALWPQDPREVEVVVEGGEVNYKINGTGYIPQDVLHIPGLGWNGIKGYSVLSTARDAMGLGLAAQKEGSEFFGDGMRPEGVLSSELAIDKGDRKDMAESWLKAHGNKRAIAILGGGLKYDRVSVTPEEAQFLETRKFQVAEIARIYRVPPHMIGDLEHATFSNIEHQGLNFVMHTLRPWIVRWEREMRRKLLSVDERRRFSVEFLVDALLRADTKTRFEAYALAINSNRPWMSVNQIRELENWNPTEDGDDMTPSVNVQPAQADAA